MNISKNRVEDALRTEDIEDLIYSGAPQDEYSMEADSIAKALKCLPRNQLNEQTCIATIAMIWAKSFNRSPQEIEKRKPAFRRIALKILKGGES